MTSKITKQNESRKMARVLRNNFKTRSVQIEIHKVGVFFGSFFFHNQQFR